MSSEEREEIDFDYECEAGPGPGPDEKLCFKKKAIRLSSSYFGVLDHSKPYRRRRNKQD